MFFFTLSNVDIQFAWGKFTQLSYTTKEALLTISHIKLIDKKEFTKAVLDKNLKAFIVHMFFLNLELINLDKETQITSLLIEKIIVLDEYLDFTNIFSKQQVLVQSEQIEPNQHTIELQDSK